MLTFVQWIEIFDPQRRPPGPAHARRRETPRNTTPRLAAACLDKMLQAGPQWQLPPDPLLAFRVIFL